MGIESYRLPAVSGSIFCSTVMLAFHAANQLSICSVKRGEQSVTLRLLSDNQLSASNHRMVFITAIGFRTSGHCQLASIAVLPGMGTRRYSLRPRRDVCRSRDVTETLKWLHVIMIADVNLFSRPLIIA